MEQDKKHRNRAKSIALLIAGLAVFAGLVSVCFFYLYQGASENVIVAKENEEAHSAAQINAFLSESIDVVKLAAYSLSYMMDSGERKEVLLSYLERESQVYVRAIDGNFTGLYGVFDDVYLDGIGWMPEEGYEPKERPWYQAAVEAGNDVALVTPYRDSQTGSITMSISKLLTDRESVVSLDVRLDGIQEIMEERVLREYCRYAMLLDKDGYVIAHSQASEVGEDYAAQEGTLGNLIVKKLYSSKGNHFEVRSDRTNYLVFFSKISSGWYDVTVVDKRELLSGLIWIYVVFFLIVFGVWVGIVWIFYRIAGKQLRTERYNRQLETLADIYEYIYLIEPESDTFSVVGFHADGSGVTDGKRRADAQLKLRVAMDNMTDERFKKSIFEFTDFSTLKERLDGKQTITREFIDNSNALCRSRFMADERNEDGSLRTVLWMLERVGEGKDGGV